MGGIGVLILLGAGLVWLAVQSSSEQGSPTIPPPRTGVPQPSPDRAVVQRPGDVPAELARLRTNAPISCVAVLPDGRRILAGGGPGLSPQGKPFPLPPGSALRLWDLESGQLVRRFEGHTAGVTSLALSTDGRRALTGSYDATVRLWDVETGQEIRRLEGHPGWVVSVALAADGRQAVSGGQDAVVRLWDVETGQERRRLAGHAAGPVVVALSPDGKLILSGSGHVGSGEHALCLWDAATGRELRRLPGHQDGITSVAFAPDGQQAASGSKDGTVRLWDVVTGEELRVWKVRAEQVPTLAFAPDGRRLLAATVGGALLLDVDREAEVRVYGLGVGAAAAAFLPDQRRAVLGGLQQALSFWDLTARPSAFIRPAQEAKGAARTPRPQTTSEIVIGSVPAGKAAPARPALLLRAAQIPAEGNFGPGVLARELVRQAVLLTARDGLGLVVRDEVLGESLPDPAGTLRLALALTFDPQSRTLSAELRRPDGTQPPLWAEEFRVGTNDPALYSDFVLDLEAATRAALPEALRKAGLAAGPAAVPGTTAVPAEVEDLLSQMTFLAQYQALRQLHALARAQGESPQLLGGLVRAYANLGVLSEYHWSVAHKVYKARALLHAQRLVASDSRSPVSLSHRAYARGLAGMHAAALADLAAARREAKKSRMQGTTSPLPAWAGLLDAYCRFDSGTLAGQQPGEWTGLAGLLRFLTVERTDTPHLTLRTAREVLKENPECYRVHEGMAAVGGVGNLHVATQLGAQVFSAAVGARLARMADLPEPVARVLKDADEETGIDEARLVRTLAEAGVTDTADATWGVLARLLQETRFAQLWRRLHFMRFWWSVPVEDVLPEILARTAGHPYHAVLPLYGIDEAARKEALKDLVRKLPFSELGTASSSPFLEFFRHMGWEAAQSIYPGADAACDAVYQDGLGRLVVGGEKTAVAHATQLLAISPYAPAARAGLIAHDGNRVAREAAAWAVESDAQIPVLAAFARRAMEQKRPEEAERYLKAYLRISPDAWAYELLAQSYADRGDEQRWLQTLEESLQQEESGLAHARVRVRLANHFMEQKQWAKAQPYAEAAAASYAGWAMPYAAECAEQLGDWTRAELWMRRLSERYPQSAGDWFFWCRRTGRGQEAEARRLAAARYEALPERASEADLENAAIFFLLTERPARASEAFARCWQQHRSVHGARGLALLADAEGNTAVRDEHLRHAASCPVPVARVLALFRDCLAQGKPLDLQAVEAVFQELTPAGATESCYLVGRFLELRGQRQEAARYYRRCADASQAFAGVRALAAEALRKLEGNGGPTRAAARHAR